MFSLKTIFVAETPSIITHFSDKTLFLLRDGDTLIETLIS